MLKKFDGSRSKHAYDITGDGSCFYYYDPETKRQSEVWIARNNPISSKIRRLRSFGKHMFAIFFMMSGFNTVTPLENSKTVTAKWHTEECVSNVLRQVKKHRRLNDLLRHHANASSYNSNTNNEIFRSST